ncbi:DUF1972 domain-containing protein [Chitinophaga sp. 22321]|uniref:DUF1972 domain-containing protein n=1 Tax=Chitinophaga hostae TaxID=2831022 RepID=A0ABS5J296_9BACT|nr:DUF1972 domain-containing protein [Chitinophaga hostae]MBS0028557.1 DUF1972 domain-containing protein [Chitinophaga hostae]
MKKVAIIGTVGIPAGYGGFETLVHHLVQHLDNEFDFTVYCSAPAYKDKPARFGRTKLEYIRLNANGAQSIPYDIVSMTSAVFSGHDILLVLGVSGALFLPFIRLFTNKKLIVHIDGLEWRRNKWNTFAKKFLKFSEYIGVKFGHKIIADNSEIRTYIEQEYQKDSCLIEYGADHIIQNLYPQKGSYAFSVCRIEPENNIHVILEAFSQSGQPIKFVGNWEKSAYGKALREKYSAFDNIELLAPIYDQEKLDLLRSNCKVYIHGHSAGGTNPSLVEAMYLGLPIFAFDVPYNRATTEDKCLYFEDAAALTKLLKEKSEGGSQVLNAIGCDMKEIAKRRYEWSIISESYRSVLEAV